MKLSKDGSGEGAACGEGQSFDLFSMIADLLGGDVEDLRQNSDLSFVELGGDSVKAIQLAFKLEAIGLPFKAETVMEMENSLHSIAEQLNTFRETISSSSTDDATLGEEHYRPFSMLQNTGLDTVAAQEDACEQIQCTVDQLSDLLPMTNQQKGLWLGSMKQDGAYIGHWTYNIPEGIQLDKLEDAWFVVLQQTPILRSRVVHLRDGSMWQAVLQAKRSNLDLSLSMNSGETEIPNSDKIVAQYGSPLVKLRLGPRKSNTIELSAHHCVYDRWSMQLILQDVRKAYAGVALTARPSFVPFLTPLEATERDALQQAWRDLLASATVSRTSTFLERDRSPLATKTSQSSVDIPTQMKFTVAALTTAAWSLVCSRHRDPVDSVFGLTLWGRDMTTPATIEMAFPTFSTLPFPASVKPEDTVEQLLQDTNQRLSQVRALQRLGTDEIANLDHTARGMCKFSSVLVVQPELMGSSDTGPMLPQDLKSYELYLTHALLVECTTTKQTLSVRMYYDPYILSAEAVDPLLSQLCNAIRLLSSQPKSLLGELDLLGEADQQQIQRWIRPSDDLVDDTLHGLVLAQASRTPQATAIWQTGFTMSYDDLVRDSRHVASLIQTQLSKNLGSNQSNNNNIGVFFPKSHIAIVAMVGILMTGNTYVPLDPSHPQARLDKIIQDGEIALVLCSPDIAPRLDDSGCHKLELDLETSKATGSNQASSTVSVNSEDSAYMIYTSGSTGTAKGVVISHGAICTSVRALGKRFKFDSSVRTFQFSSFAWDASCHDIWITLATGGVICLPSEEERLEPSEFLKNSRVNYGMLTTTVASAMPADAIECFTRVVFTGEPVTSAVLHRWVSPEREVLGAYGPTETTIVVLITTFPSPTSNPKNLGFCYGATTWIVNENDPNKLAPIGSVGELVTSGHVLAKGYWQDEAKTKRAFLEDLAWFKAFPGSDLRRVYLSGDLVCYNPDGSLQYVGRKGGYTKIAGNRVDLGEIEHALYAEGESFQDISLQVTHLSFGARSRDILICFIKSKRTSRSGPCQLVDHDEEVSTDVAKVYQSLRYQLPSYMIPSLFVTVSYIPIMSSGKVDARLLKDMIQNAGHADLQRRYGLPELEISKVETNGNDTSGPLNSKAEEIAEAWSVCLGLPRSMLKASSHFFRMGGDSVAAMRVSAHLRERGVILHVSDIFSTPLLSKMAACVQDVDGAEKFNLHPKPFALVDLGTGMTIETLIKTAATQVGVSESSVEDIFPCSPLQVQMLVASDRSPRAYIHCETFQLARDINDDDIQRACRSLVDKNPMLRSRAFIVEETGEFLQVVVTATDVSVFGPNVARNVTQDDKPTSAIGLRTPLCRFSLRDNGGKRHLVWEMHHAIYDGHSHSLLLKQFHQNLLLQDNPKLSSSTKPPPNPPPYQSFIAYLNAADNEKSLRFWQEYLSGAERMTSPVFTERGKSTTNSKMTSAVQVAWNASQFTHATYLKTAYALTIANYAGSNDIVYGETFHGRDAALPGMDEMVGPTFATIPARVKFDQKQSVEELLDDIQRDSASRTLHQQLPIDKIGSLGPEYRKVTQFDTHFLVQTINLDSSYESLEQVGCTRMTEGADMNLAIPLSVAVTIVNKDKIQVEAIFDSGFIPSLQVELFLDQYKATLDALLASDGSVAVEDLSPLGAHNVRSIMAVQPSRRRANTFDTIPDLIFSNLQNRGSHEALYSSTKSYTYDDMNRIGLALVARIRSIITTPRQLVGLCLDKSPLAIISQLAVMRSGHGYVPLDPSHPTTRHRRILSQTKCSLLLLSPRHAKLFDDFHQHMLVIDDDKSFEGLPAQDQSIEPVSPDDVAYVIYTSGSTGDPKGVVIEHKSICITIQQYAKRLNFTAGTRSMLFAAFTFDASVMETWAILTAGGCLCIPSDEERISNLDQFIVNAKADVVCLTPTGAMLLDPLRHKNLKTLLLCGEKCRPSDVERWIENDTNLVNAYGPTETSVCATINSAVRLASSDDEIGQSLDAGVWIMDPENHERHLPVGSVGELCLSGDTLARGYLDDLAKTTDKFVSPKWPEWTKLGSHRVYKTGDLAWIDSHGKLHYVGRKDSQLKLNGIRIEAGEIEATVTGSDLGVQETVAITYNYDSTSNSSLALFFVRKSPGDAVDHRRGTTTITAMTNQDHDLICRMDQIMQKTLPPASIPSVYLPLNSIPHNSSTKIDRKLLKSLVENLHASQIAVFSPNSSSASQHSGLSTQPNGNESNFQTSDAALATQTERKLAELWASVFRQSANSFDRASHFVQKGGGK